MRIGEELYIDQGWNLWLRVGLEVERLRLIVELEIEGGLEIGMELEFEDGT
jgi:hypothetical protein